MDIQENPIGIFDSGIGGLTVFKAIREALPSEGLIYLGDTARVPYGTKSAETIIRYSLENAGFLIRRGVKAIVVACNTSSAYALPALAENSEVPIIGVIEPGVKEALRATKNNHIGVIGTSSTIVSNRYAVELKRHRSEVSVISLACPLFVPLAEEGWTDNDVARLVSEKYLKTMRSEEIDTLILGCTHYPLLKGVIQDVMGESVRLVDSAEAVAAVLKDVLFEKGMASLGGRPSSSGASSDQIYVTDLSDRFEMVAHRFLGGDLPSVKRIEL